MRAIVVISMSLLLLVTISCGTGDRKEGSGTIVSESRAATEVTTVESEGIIEVEIVRSADPYITVITDDNIVGDVLTDITGSSLLISLRDANYSNVSVAVSVGMPAVTSVENDGTGAITYSGFEGLDVLTVESNGTGDLDFSGSAAVLDLTTSGTGGFKGFDFTAGTLQVDMTGTGDVEVTVSDRIEGELTGTGDLTYKGMPLIDVTVTGLGSIRDGN